MCAQILKFFREYCNYYFPGRCWAICPQVVFLLGCLKPWLPCAFCAQLTQSPDKHLRACVSSLAGSVERSPSRPGRVLYHTPPAVQTHLAWVVLEILISRKQVSVCLCVVVGGWSQLDSRLCPLLGWMCLSKCWWGSLRKGQRTDLLLGKERCREVSVGLSWVLRAQKP